MMTQKEENALKNRLLMAEMDNERLRSTIDYVRSAPEELTMDEWMVVNLYRQASDVDMYLHNATTEQAVNFTHFFTSADEAYESNKYWAYNNSKLAKKVAVHAFVNKKDAKAPQS